MNAILIAELFGALNLCVEDHMVAGRLVEALALLQKIRVFNLEHAARGGRVIGTDPQAKPPVTFSEN